VDNLIADLIDHHDEVFLWIQRVFGTDVDVREDLVRPRVPRRDQDGIVLCRTQLAERCTCELAIPQGIALFEDEVAQVEQFVGAMHLR